jgi:hypothetical protein
MTNIYKYRSISLKFHVMARLTVYSRFLVPHTRISNPEAVAILLNSYPNLVRDYPHLKDVDFEKETKIELDKIHEEVDRQYKKEQEKI